MQKERSTKVPHRAKNGFSLVELLVCVVILGIIAVPFYNSFLVSQRANEKAKKIQKTMTLAQNIMETIKSKNIREVKSAFATSNIPLDLNLLSPYDCSLGVVQIIKEDQVAGSYEFSIKRVKDGNFEYDVFVSLDAAPFKSGAVGVQNNYQMPEITSLKGEKVAVINPLESFTGWSTADGGVTYTKDASSSLDNTVLDYYYNLHMSYIDQLIMDNQTKAENENALKIASGLVPDAVPDPLPSYYPYSKNDIKGFIEKDIQIEAANEITSLGVPDFQKVKLMGKIIYRIPSMSDPARNVTADISDLISEYQIFSKGFSTTDGSNPLEQIYIFYEKPLEGLGDDTISLKNQSINPATVNIVLQSDQAVKVNYNDPSLRWELVSNKASKISVLGSYMGSGISNELVRDQVATDRLYRVVVDVYEHNSVDRAGNLVTTLTSTKEE